MEPIKIRGFLVIKNKKCTISKISHQDHTKVNATNKFPQSSFKIGQCQEIMLENY